MSFMNFQNMNIFNDGYSHVMVMNKLKHNLTSMLHYFIHRSAFTGSPGILSRCYTGCYSCDVALSSDGQPQPQLRFN